MKSVSLYKNKSSTLSADKIAELVALRKDQKEHSRRVEKLKSDLFLLTAKHWDSTVSLIKAWVAQKDEPML